MGNRLSPRILILGLVFLATGPWSAYAQAQTITPGQEAKRDIGPLKITVLVNPAYAEAKVSFHLRGSFVGEQVLTADAPQYTLDAAADKDRAHGEVVLNIRAPPQLSWLQADLETQSGDDAAVPFKGMLFTWLWSDQIIYVEQDFIIAPSFTALTQVRGAAKNNVTIKLLSGSIPIAEVGLTQAAPMAQIPNEIVAGNLYIDPCTLFILTIPTPMQFGQVFMSTTFHTDTIPSTPFASNISMWSY